MTCQNLIYLKPWARNMAVESLHVSFILIAFLLPIATTAHNTRFNQFFPYYRWVFTDIRDHQCATSYASQQLDAGNLFHSLRCQEVLSCILEHTREHIKMNMTGASVGLSLMPTLLTFLGSSTTETALLSRRRPLLSFLIACGSPAVNPLPAFTYQDPMAVLKAREGQLLPQFFPRLSTLQATVIVLAEYTLVLTAMTNVITASYYMGLWTINAIACSITFLPILWVGSTVLIHLLGMLALALQTEIIRDSKSRERIWARISQRMRYEIQPCIIHDKIILKPKENIIFIFISWLTSIATVFHLLLGTIVLSSTTLIGKFLR